MSGRAWGAAIALAIFAFWSFTTGRELIGAIAFSAEMLVYGLAPRTPK